uniref:Uncharacterized protein n=1 Tax=Schistosoma curassoni TaxID=6186 RepID=A0A183L7P1_9TREM
MNIDIYYRLRGTDPFNELPVTEPVVFPIESQGLRTSDFKRTNSRAISSGRCDNIRSIVHPVSSRCNLFPRLQIHAHAPL